MQLNIKKILGFDIPRKERKLKKQFRLNKRIWELDFIRGICMILMVWDHLLISVRDVFGRAWVAADFGTNVVAFAREYLQGELRATVRPLIVFLFVFICGISCTFSGNNLKRGLVMAVLSILITLVTQALDMAILFGFLHMLTLSVLFYAVLELLCFKNKKILAVMSLIVGTIIFFIYFYFEKVGYPVSDNPAMGIFYWDDAFRKMTTDYAPFVEHAGSLFLGAAFGAVCYKNKKSLLSFFDPSFKSAQKPLDASPINLDDDSLPEYAEIHKKANRQVVYIEYDGKMIEKKIRWYRPVNFIGRHGLWVYGLHQVVIVAILGLVSYIWATPGNFIIF